MNLAIIPGSTSTPVMSSREIAELCEKQHKDVMRDIRNMLESLDEPLAQFCADLPDSYGRLQPAFILPKDLTFTLVAGYNVKLRKRIIDRWIELEQQSAPSLPNFSDPVAAARAWADAKEAEQKALVQLEAAKPAVEFVDRFVDASGSKGIREVAKLLRANEREFIAFLIDSQIMYRLGGRLTPYAQHLDAGRFEVKAGVAQNEHAYTTARFTAKGIQWIGGLWIARHFGGEA